MAASHSVLVSYGYTFAYFSVTDNTIGIRLNQPKCIKELCSEMPYVTFNGYKKADVACS